MKTRGANNCENMSKNEVEITPKSLKNEPWNSIKNDAQKHAPKNRKIRQIESALQQKKNKENRFQNLTRKSMQNTHQKNMIFVDRRQRTLCVGS